LVAGGLAARRGSVEIITRGFAFALATEVFRLDCVDLIRDLKDQ
jgi:hypothetical protein